MNRIENTGQIKTGYSVKSGTNPEEKVENGSDFASMLTKYKKKAAQDDETKRAETGETKNKETQPEETKSGENGKQVNGSQSGKNKKTAEIKAEIKVTDIQDGKNSQDGEIEQDQELAAAYASETCYRSFVQITTENNKMPAVYNNGIQDLAVQTTSETGMEDQTAAVSTIQQTESPHSEIAVHADSLKLQNRLEQTGETEDTGRTEETGQSKQTAKMNREEEIPDQKEHLSGKEMTALASSGYTGTVESSAGTAAKPAAVDTGPADRLATAQDTLTEDLGNYLDTKISEKKGKLELSLEPERLGKLTIRLEYEKGKTEVTIFSTSAKTLEILSKEAGHLAQILEEKTGTPTVIYTPEQTENRQNMDQDPGHSRNGRQDQKEQRQKQDDSFAQQLRLGLA